jgi:hypothetical protein
VAHSKRRVALWLVAVGLAAVAVFLFVNARQVNAHEARELGPYRISFGWRVEPAFVGVPSGPEFRLRMLDDETELIEGADETLKLTVKFGNQTREVPIREAFGDPGHYVGSLTPTRAGDYEFHLTGTIGDEEIDEIFTSADGMFGTVEPASDILFPDSKLDPGSLKAEIDALKRQIETLKADIAALQEE